MQELLGRLDTDTVKLSRYHAYALPDTTLTSGVDTIQILIGRLTAIQAALVREIDGRGLVKRPDPPTPPPGYATGSGSPSTTPTGSPSSGRCSMRGRSSPPRSATAA